MNHWIHRHVIYIYKIGILHLIPLFLLSEIPSIPSGKTMMHNDVASIIFPLLIENVRFLTLFIFYYYLIKEESCIFCHVSYPWELQNYPYIYIYMLFSLIFISLYLNFYTLQNLSLDFITSEIYQVILVLKSLNSTF